MGAFAKLRRSVPLLLAGCAVAAATGQTVSFLTPVKYTARVGETVAVRLDVSDVDVDVVRGVDWPTERIDWLFIRSPGEQQNREDVGPAEPRGDSINVTPARPGVTMIGLDTRPGVVNVFGKRLRAFAERVALDPSHERALAGIDEATPVRVRRVESAKTLIRVPDPDGRPASHSAIAQSKTGQKVEIRALADPTTVPVGSDLPVKAYLHGDKLVGAKALATCVATGKTQAAITDSTGACHFTLTDSGAWRIEFHHAEPLEKAPDADWVIYSATLTFEAAETGAGK